MKKTRMSRKHLVYLAVFAIIMLGSLWLPGLIVVQASPLPNQVRQDFYQVLRGYVSRYGIVPTQPAVSWQHTVGVHFTKLIDFDQNGIPELLIAYSVASWGTTYRVYHWTPTGVNRTLYFIWSMGSWHSHYSFMESSSGDLFFRVNSPALNAVFPSDRITTYFSFVNGDWVNVLELEQSFVGTYYYGSDFASIPHEEADARDLWYILYFVDGVRVSLAEYQSATNTHLDTGGLRLQFLDWGQTLHEPETVHSLLTYLSEVPSISQPYANPLTQNITPYGRQAAETFLRNFWTIFRGHGWQDNSTGVLYYGFPSASWHSSSTAGNWASHWITDVSAYAAPLVYFSGERFNLSWGDTNPPFAFETIGSSWGTGNQVRVYDIGGNHVSTAPFMLSYHLLNSQGSMVATNFRLYDLTGNGIPEIFVEFGYGHFMSHWEGHGVRSTTVIFTYHQGDFVPAANFQAGTDLFVAADGSIIMLVHGDEVFGNVTPDPGFYQLQVLSNRVDFIPIHVPPLHEWPSAFHDHLSGMFYWNEVTWERGFNPGLTVFPTGQSIYPVSSLTDFETAMVSNVQQYLHIVANVILGNEVDEIIAPAIIDTDAVYIHTPPATWSPFTPNPATLQSISTPTQAISTIQQLVSLFTPVERTDPTFLINATLHIENLISRGATTSLPRTGIIDWSLLESSATTARNVLDETLQILETYELNPLRRLRQNLHFQQQGNPGELSVTFNDLGATADFDNVVVQSSFASVAIHRDFITENANVEVRLLDMDESLASVSGRALDFEQMRNDLSLALASINWLSLSVVTHLWSIFVLIAVAILYTLLVVFKKHLRLWVSLSFVTLAAIANVYTLTLHGGELQLPDNVQNLTIAVDVTNNVVFTLSLPVEHDEQDLILINADGHIIPTRYNPSTGTIDSRISESGYYRVIKYSISFADIQHSAAIMQETIVWLGTRGIMAGSVEGNFYPDQPITRAEFTATVVNAFNLLDLDAQHQFLDVLPQDWFYTAVASAYKQDLVEGFADQTFRPDWDMAKGQLIVVIGRILMEQMDYHVPDNIDQLLQDFTDVEDLPAWAIEAIALTNATNILIHRYDGLFASNTVMTRGDAAIILYRLFSRVW